jgi:hypothetical protein
MLFPASAPTKFALVNVHTRNLAIPAAQAEAGNFPGGEVRGQIDHGNGM